MFRFFVPALGGILMSWGLSGAAQAQATTDQCPVSKSDWTVCLTNTPKHCWAASSPKSVVNRRGGQVTQSASRGTILLLVSFHPGENVKGQLAFVGGYNFAPGSTVQLRIGGSSWTLTPGTQGDDREYAWAAPGDDAEIVAAMKRGAQAVLVGTSARPTETTDTFSLIGFTAAYDEAAKRCS